MVLSAVNYRFLLLVGLLGFHASIALSEASIKQRESCESFDIGWPVGFTANASRTQFNIVSERRQKLFRFDLAKNKVRAIALPGLFSNPRYFDPGAISTNQDYSKLFIAESFGD